MTRLFLLTMIGAAASLISLAPVFAGQGPTVATFVAIIATVICAGGLAFLLRFGAAEERRSFGKELAQILVGILCLGGFVAIALFWNARKEQNERFKTWFLSVCGTPVSVEETMLQTTRCYQCKTGWAVPKEFLERTKKYGGQAAFAYGVRVCTSEE